MCDIKRRVSAVTASENNEDEELVDDIGLQCSRNSCPAFGESLLICRAGAGDVAGGWDKEEDLMTENASLMTQAV